MKNREFIVIILCICLFWGIWLYLQNPTWNVVATDNFERNLWCASLTVGYETFVNETVDFIDSGLSHSTNEINIFYSKEIKDCVVSYHSIMRESDWTRYNDYVIENYFSKDILFSCNNTEDNTWLTNKDCRWKREDWKLALKPWYNTESFYIEQ